MELKETDTIDLSKFENVYIEILFAPLPSTYKDDLLYATYNEMAYLQSVGCLKHYHKGKYKGLYWKDKLCEEAYKNCADDVSRYNKNKFEKAHKIHSEEVSRCKAHRLYEESITTILQNVK